NNNNFNYNECLLIANNLIYNIIGNKYNYITLKYWIYSQLGKLLSPIEICKKQFKHLDVNNDGYISSQDIIHMFNHININQANQIIQNADSDNDGLINFDNFLDFMKFQ